MTNRKKMEGFALAVELLNSLETHSAGRVGREFGIFYKKKNYPPSYVMEGTIDKLQMTLYTYLLSFW